MLYNLFLKIPYFLWSYDTLRSVGSVVRGASEHLEYSQLLGGYVSYTPYCNGNKKEAQSDSGNAH